MKTKFSRRWLALLLPMSLLMAGCAQQAAQAETDGYITYTQAKFPYVANIPLKPSDKPATLERQLGGQVIAWNRLANTALMGFNSAPEQEVFEAQGLFSSMFETNRRIFNAGAALATMGGRKATWFAGDMRAWAEGRKATWFAGNFALIPENTAAFKQIGLEEAQKLSPSLGQGIKVAVIDTGLDLDHAAFAGALAPANEWKDFVDGDSIPQDEGELGVGGYGHGTAVAAIILQVAPNATILPIRVLGPDGSGDLQAVAQAIEYAASKGVRVINLSLGSDETSSTVASAITWATLRGVHIVSSAGNDNRSTITYPARHALNLGVKNYSMSVGSVDSADNKSSFSNYSTSVRISAPGEGIYTAGPDDTLVAWSGTSMAAPMVSGALALAYSKPNTNLLSNWQWAGKLSDTATGIYSSGKNAAYLKQIGTKGRLNIPAFLKSGL